MFASCAIDNVEFRKAGKDSRILSLGDAQVIVPAYIIWRVLCYLIAKLIKRWL